MWAQNWRPSMSLLNGDKVQALHDAATQILETTGLNVHHQGMRRRLHEEGARLGADARVYLSPRMVQNALDSVPQSVVIHDRTGKAVMTLGPHEVYFGTGSDLIYTRDLETGERRLSVLDDVGRAARLCDALDEIDFVMSFALPSDVPSEDVEPWQYLALVQNTAKPVIMTSFSGMDALERQHQMACLIAGGDEEFRQRPNYIMYGQFVSPLQHDLQALERLIFCAEHSVPLIYVATIMPGASGPLTLSGSLALAAAESLAGLVMHQTWRPGAPCIFGACVSRLDMSTMLFPYGSPEWRLNDLVMAELARHYGLPVFGTGGATDSKSVDAQTGAEYASSLLAAALAGTNLIHDVGYIDSGLTGDLTAILLGAEEIRWVKRFMNGFEFSAEHLALGEISRVGPGGQFLDSIHTLRFLRRTMWRPYALDHNGFDAWGAAGSLPYSARARQQVRDLLSSHEPMPMDARLSRDLGDLCGLFH